MGRKFIVPLSFAAIMFRNMNNNNINAGIKTNKLDNISFIVLLYYSNTLFYPSDI